MQWLGEIPAHWEIKRLGSYFKERRTKVSDKYYNPLSVTKNGIYPQLENVAKSNDGDNRKLVLKNDFVINSRSDRKGSSGVSQHDGSVSLINIVLIPDIQKISQLYCHYLFRSYAFIEEYYRNGRGIVADLWTTRYEEMKMIKIAIPPYSEQETIAAYLDSEVSKIDEAIKQQQKMIELLNERRQIIISEAVTKGVNPDVQMKDSGIDWMGAIPAHWEIISLKRACTIKTGKTPSSNSTKYWDGGKVNWFTPGDFKDFKLTDSERKVTRTAIRENACFEYPACSVYLIGIGGTIGKIAYSEHSASCNQQINVLIPKRNVHYKYIAYVMTICRPEVMRNANMSTLPIINQEKTGGIMITLPPFLEQKAISQQIEVKCASIQEKINQANTEIALLTERKRIIINDVVTGKIKVL